MKDLLRRVAEQSLSDLKVDEQVEEVKLVREKKVKRDEAAQGLPSVFQRPIFATEGPLEKFFGPFGETIPQFQLQKWQLTIPLVHWVVWWIPDIQRGWE